MAISPQIESALRAERVRPDFVPASDYISPEFTQLEYERLWPRVWQLACREQEIARVGDYVTYDIGDQSIIVVRQTGGAIKAFFNVCMHRGRRLTTDCGNVVRFHCTYHGWQWGLDGKVLTVLDRTDWKGCAGMDDGDLKLREVKVETWAGFVFVNFDPNAEPLAKFLDPVPAHLNPYEYANMSFRFYASFRLPCNWKVALEAFDEGYHVAATHPQLLPVQGEDWTNSFAKGKHGMFMYPMVRADNGQPSAPFGAPSPRLGRPVPKDVRAGVAGHFDLLVKTLPVLYSIRDGEAAQRLLTEVGPDTPPLAVLGKALEFQREAAIAAGAGWPDITPEQMRQAGVDWHIFPNMITLPYPDGAIVYRSRPDGADPDSCIYDVWGLQRYAPGAEPPIDRKLFHGKDDWRGVGAVSIILEQDFMNMEQVQRGMKSHGFPGSRTSPKQEVAISNMHRVLREEYVFGAQVEAQARRA